MSQDQFQQAARPPRNVMNELGELYRKRNDLDFEIRDADDRVAAGLDQIAALREQIRGIEIEVEAERVRKRDHLLPIYRSTIDAIRALETERLG